MEIELELDDESYGGSPISFQEAATRIGTGVIGDEDTRVAAGVPVLIGTNTLGKVSEGLYTEFPVVIIAE